LLTFHLVLSFLFHFLHSFPFSFLVHFSSCSFLHSRCPFFLFLFCFFLLLLLCRFAFFTGFNLFHLYLENKNGLMRSPCCLCNSVGHISFWLMFMLWICCDIT
jgi:hypothetical protein